MNTRNYKPKFELLEDRMALAAGLHEGVVDAPKVNQESAHVIAHEAHVDVHLLMEAAAHGKEHAHFDFDHATAHALGQHEGQEHGSAHKAEAAHSRHDPFETAYDHSEKDPTPLEKKLKRAAEYVNGTAALEVLKLEHPMILEEELKALDELKKQQGGEEISQYDLRLQLLFQN